jgi:hypothetical protein
VPSVPAVQERTYSMMIPLSPTLIFRFL